MGAMPPEENDLVAALGKAFPALTGLSMAAERAAREIERLSPLA
jgi:hypothetical protein